MLTGSLAPRRAERRTFAGHESAFALCRPASGVPRLAFHVWRSASGVPRTACVVSRSDRYLVTSFADFLARANVCTVDGGLVPVWRDCLLDLCTPVAAFAKLRRGPFAFLLESAPAGG